MTLICKYCGKECKNDNSLRNHERLCHSNPNRQILKSNFIEYNKKRKESGLKGTNQYVKARELGLEVPKCTEETKNKIRKSQIGRHHSEDVKQKISESMKRAVREHPESYSSCNVNGRVKKVEYKNIVLNGKWELEVAQFLDKNQIEWERPKIGFEYIWNNGTHIYYPDFYLPALNLYIEVKGYERERDRYKWAVVKKLLIIKVKEINEIRKGTFIIKLLRA